MKPLSIRKSSKVRNIRNNMGFIFRVAFPTVCLSVSQAAPPNVLFIVLDDFRPEAGAYGRTEIKTPHIDQLARQGTTFTRAYCQVPVCGASRGSLISGVRPLVDRFTGFDVWVEQELPTAQSLPQVFKEAGYNTLSNGKVFHHKEDMGTKSWTEPAWKTTLDPLTFLDPESQNYVGGTANRGPFYEAAVVHDTAYTDGKTADKTISDLRRLRTMGKPFFLAFGLDKPHLPFYAPKRYYDLYDPNTLTLADNQYRPVNSPANLVSSQEFSNYGDRNIVYNSPAFHRAALHGYYASVSYADAQVGRVLQELTNLGIRDSTIVVLWGDHGWNLGEHAFWSKHNLTHNSIHVPLIFSGPGVPVNQRQQGLVEFVDLFPTLMDMAGIRKSTALDTQLQGTSFKPLLDYPLQPWKKAVFSRYKEGETIVTASHTYTEYSTTARMLYNRITDPKENTNIAGVAAQQALVDSLSRMLRLGWRGFIPTPVPLAHPHPRGGSSIRSSGTVRQSILSAAEARVWNSSPKDGKILNLAIWNAKGEREKTVPSNPTGFKWDGARAGVYSYRVRYFHEQNGTSEASGRLFVW